MEEVDFDREVLRKPEQADLPNCDSKVERVLVRKDGATQKQRA